MSLASVGVEIVAFVVAGGVVLRGIERIFTARDASSAPMRTTLLARERLTDVAHIVFNRTVTQPLVKLVGFATFVAFVMVFRLPHDPSHLYDVWHRDARFAGMPLRVQAPLALVFADFVGYWSHRALHHGFFWRFHAVHHSSRALDWLAGARNHPVAEALSTLAGGAALLALGFDPRVLGMFAPLGLYAILLHANIAMPRVLVRVFPRETRALRYIVATPLFHRWHHAHASALPSGREHGVNFAALLPLWDLVFGTFHAADGAQPPAFGADAPVPKKFIGQLIFPFRRN